METGFIGLGKMGFNMVTRLLQGGHRVVAYNRDGHKVEHAVQIGAASAFTLGELTDKLTTPRTIWLMVPAGDVTEGVLSSLLPFLSPGDLIIDGGNSYYKDSMRRAGELKNKGFHFLDAGTSGGIWGLEKGYCLMVGGEKNIFSMAEPLFATLAPPDGYLLAGKSGAGHFAKMIHNGIEYGLMQAYAEGIEILHAKKEFDFDMGAIMHLWNQGSVVRSWLLELAENIFEQDKDLSAIAGYVEDSGEGRWTVTEALDNNVPAPVITLSLLTRQRSRQDESYGAKVLAALRNRFGGHSMKQK
jgi:6-phosphogluconate dehydrogenase